MVSKNLKDEMLAVKAYSRERFELEQVEVPSVGEDDVLVRVLASEICGSDRKLYHGGNRLWDFDFPFIVGHEYVGEVVKIGELVANRTEFEIGDLAVAEVTIPCGECFYCRRGLYHLCNNSQTCAGGWAEYALFPKGSIKWKVPSSVPVEVGALIEPLSCAIHSIKKASIGQGDVVLISGLGAIGLLILQVALLKNPPLVIGVDVREEMLELADHFGAEVTVNPSKVDVFDKTQQLTDGLGVDVSIEASGSASALNTSIKSLRKRGRLVVFGNYEESLDINFTRVSDGPELEIFGSHLGPNSYDIAIHYLKEGLIDGASLITHTFSLDNFKDAIEVADPNRVKVILKP